MTVDQVTYLTFGLALILALVFDLGIMSSFAVYQQTGTGIITTPYYGQNTNTIATSAGTMWSVKSEQKCKYLAKQTVKYQWSSGTAIITYTW